MPSASYTFENSVIAPVNAVITSGGTKSSAIEVYGCTLAAIETPAAFTGTSITFEGSIDGTTYCAIHDKTGTAVTIGTVTTSKAYALDPTVFYAFRFVKIVSSGAEGADRTIKCGLVKI